METITIKIGGMTCQGCVRSVSNVLTRLAGVETARVSLEQGVAEVHFDASKIDAQQLRAAVEAAGYTAAG